MVTLGLSVDRRVCEPQAVAEVIEPRNKVIWKPIPFIW